MNREENQIGSRTILLNILQEGETETKLKEEPEVVESVTRSEALSLSSHRKLSCDRNKCRARGPEVRIVLSQDRRSFKRIIIPKKVKPRAADEEKVGM
jgi:hypothetical protein